MKNIITTLFLAVLFLFSCTKENMKNIADNTTQDSNLTITIANQTKSVTSNTQIEDNTINTLELFIFNKDGANAGELDAYKKFGGADGLTNLTIKATTGNKIIYAVANSHKENWQGVVTLPQFQNEIVSITKDNLKDFVMIGNVEATLQLATSVTFAIERLAAKIKLNSIRTSFAGTPYEGMSLTNVKAYLINVHSAKLYHNGTVTTPTILNPKKAVNVDINSCAMPGMLYDVITPAINDAGYNTAHYFYAYENIRNTEDATNRFTRLVIQADLNGKTYYYPINLNQDTYGYDPTNGHFGLKRNTLYEVNVTIMRPGSTDPDEPVVFGTLNCTLNVLNWNNTLTANPEF